MLVFRKQKKGKEERRRNLFFHWKGLNFSFYSSFYVTSKTLVCIPNILAMVLILIQFLINTSSVLDKHFLDKRVCIDTWWLSEVIFSLTISFYHKQIFFEQSTGIQVSGGRRCFTYSYKVQVPSLEPKEKNSLVRVKLSFHWSPSF